MLDPHDADLARRDPRLPSFALLLDAEGMARALRAAWPGMGILALRPVYLRYKPGTSCLARYVAETANGSRSVHVKTYADGPKLRKRLENAPDGAGPSRALVAPGVVAYAFPDDERLEGIRVLEDEAATRALLADLLPDVPDLHDARLHVLTYKPERRLVARVDDADGPRAVVRFHAPEGHDQARLAAKAFSDEPPLRLPRRIGRSVRRGAVATTWLPGTLLSERLASPGLDPRTLERVGAALAVLHGNHPRADLRRIGPDEERDALARAAESVGRLLPALAPEVTALARRISAGLRAGSTRVVHGDFYAKQVVLEGDLVGLLDLDEAAVAAPEGDLGNFLAHLELEVVRGVLPRDRVDELGRALVEGYEAAAGKIDHELLAVHVAGRLLRLAPNPFRHREKAWAERTTAIVRRSAEIAGRLRADPGPSESPRDPALPLERALDVAEVERLLTRAIEDAPAGRHRVLRARLVRHKPGRRALVEYEVETEDPRGRTTGSSWLGKVRAKGVDRRTFRVHRDLRAAGLGEGDVLVPEPVAFVPELGLWLQRKAAGVPLAARLAEGRPDAARRAALALRRLHDAGVPAERRHGPEDELAILRDRLESLLPSRPYLADGVRELVSRCTRLADALRDAPVCGIHRDFYQDHVLLDGPRTWILDLDLYAEGDPALDAGNMVAHLVELALRKEDDAAALGRGSAAFEDAFVGDDEGLRRRVQAYTALALARHVHISTLHASRAALTERLLALALDRCAAAERALALDR